MFDSGKAMLFAIRYSRSRGVVVVDVGERERALAAVHGDDVLVGRVPAPLGQARPRRTLLPLADAEAEARRAARTRSWSSPPHAGRRCCGGTATPRGRSSSSLGPPRRPCSPRGSRCRARRGTGPFTSSIGNTLEVVVVSPNAFHSGSEIASSAAITKGNAAGSTPAIAELIAISSTVATPLLGGSTQSA